METAIRIAWLALCGLHLFPGLVAFRPGLTQRLYGVAPDGPAAVLLTHRGALFLIVAIIAGTAAFSPELRRIGSLTVGLSVVSFLLVYGRAGLPEGPLRAIAIADAAALLPLAVVAITAWRRAGAG